MKRESLPKSHATDQVERRLAVAGRRIEWLCDNLGRLLNAEERQELACMIEDVVKRMDALPESIEGALRQICLLPTAVVEALAQINALPAKATVKGRKWQRSAKRLADDLRANLPLSPDRVTECWQIGGDLERDWTMHPEARSSMHVLNGRLRHLSDSEGEWQSKLKGALDQLDSIDSRYDSVRAVLRRVKAEVLIQEVRPVLRKSLKEGVQPENINRILQLYREELAPFLQWVNIYSVPGPRAPIRYDSFLVMEDDRGWRENIRRAVETAALENSDIAALRVEMVEDERQARKRLRDKGAPCIALLDLGLPSRSGVRDVTPYRGLSLLRDWRAERPLDYVLVLTAAENYPSAIELASNAGVQPDDYIVKTPGEWETELLFRLHFALRQPGLVRVEVFQSTGCLIRIGGVEVYLEETPFCVFEYLASLAAQRNEPVYRSAYEIQRDLSDVAYQPFPDSARDVVLLFEGRDAARIKDDVYRIRTAFNEKLGRVWPGLDATWVLVSRRESPKLLLKQVETVDDEPDELVATPHVNPSAHVSQLAAKYAVQGKVVLYPSFEAQTRAAAPSPVLVVEDDATWREEIVSALSAKGFRCLMAQSLSEAKRLVAEHSPRLVSLDLLLPEETGSPADKPRGLEVLKFLREQSWAREGHGVRASVLTALAGMDKVKLDLMRSGVHLADFHIKGPHSVLRLVNSMCRLSQELERGSIFPGGETPEDWPSVRMKAAERNTIWIAWQEVHLTDAQYQLFGLLARNRNRPVNREEMKKLLWPEVYETYVETEITSDKLNPRLNNHLDRLKKVIEKQTRGAVRPDRLIRSHGPAYWLQAIVEEEV